MSELQAKDGTSLNVMRWEPSGARRGVVVLVHGYGEHIARYQHVGRALADAGFLVVGADTRGHGRSGGPRGYCVRFEEFLDDVDVIAAAASGDSDYFVLGHSFGGLIATKWLLTRRPSRVRGLVLSSPFFELKLAVPAVKMLAARIASTLFPKLAIPTGLRGSDVSRDAAVQVEFEQDALNLKNATARWVTETQRTQAEVAVQAGAISLPALLVQGAADRVASAEASARVVRMFGSTDKTVHMLEGYFHEVFNEPEAERRHAITLVHDWLLAHA